jgi:PAS domain S-box-containing protein
MAEPLSYKELESLVKELELSKNKIEESLSQKERTFEIKEAFYRKIINSSDEGIIVIQGDSFRFINDKALKLLNVSAKEIETYKFSEIIYADYRGEIIKFISQIVSGEQTNIVLESKIYTKLEEIIPVRIVLKRMMLSNNKISVLIQVNDIKVDKLKDKKINSLKKVVDFLDQHIEEGVMLLRKPEQESQNLFKWIVEDLNSAVATLIQKEKSDILGSVIGDFFKVSEDVDTESDAFFDEDIELYIENIDKYIKLNIYRISKTTIACKIMDITDFYLTKMQLNKNLQRDELFTEILHIFNSDKSYKDKYKTVLERIAYNFNTKRIIIFYHNKERAVLNTQHSKKGVSLLSNDVYIDFKEVTSWNKMLLERKMILGFSEKYIPKDIYNFFKEINVKKAYIFPIFIEEKLFGSVLFEDSSDVAWDNTEINYLKMIVGLISNLTSRESYEAKLLKSKEKAEEADRLKSSFLANMSHDIRIPMTSIIGFSDLLADPDLSIGEREEFIELISNSGQDLLTLVDNIVDIAKIETDQLVLNKNKAIISAIFNDIYANYSKNSKLVNQDDLELILDLDDEYKDIILYTDVFRLKQVFNNLIDNAIKFTDKGTIHFGISNIWDETIEFYVKDTGIGIAEDIQDVVFKSFSKADRTYTREYNGTGLGLAISKSIVELAGGEIRIVSHPGKGSVFYFTHPLPKESSSSVVEKKHKNRVDYNWEHLTILIVEDIEQNYKYLEYVLASTKAKIIWFKNGLEVVNYFKEENTCDCILMDIQMPEMNGIEASEIILKDNDIPIIIQTAYTLSDEIETALKVGCVDYIPKPVSSKKLLKLIEKYTSNNK